MGNAVTGGPEAQHQLVDTLVHQGCDASILYWPPDGSWDVPDCYRTYETPVVRLAEMKAGSVVVLPETMVGLARHFSTHRLFIWWLSVDNYLGRVADSSYGRLLQRATHGLHTRRSAEGMKPLEGVKIEGHLAQSWYATQFLGARGLASMPLSDYTSTNATPRSAVPNVKSQLRVALNGNKGVRLAERFIELDRHNTYTFIRNFSRQEVSELLANVDVYIDFGTHPGKDRLPREAANAGCVVFVRRAGAAINDVDVPLPKGFKFDDDRRSQRGLVETLGHCRSNFSDSYDAQDTYRLWIADERSRFTIEVSDWLDSL
jgi:hypothetical protein